MYTCEKNTKSRQIQIAGSLAGSDSIWRKNYLKTQEVVL